MLPKFILSLVAVLLMAGMTAGVTQAAPLEQEIQAENTQNFVGVITSVEDSQFTVKTRRGVKTVQVDADTQYHSRSGEASFDDLSEGLIVAVSATLDPNGDVLAKRVLILEKGTAWRLLRARTVRGEIWSIDLSTNTFVLHSGREELAFTVTSETKFRSPGGAVQSLADLEVHQHILVHFQPADDGKLEAKLIIARAGRATVHRGEITALDLEDMTLSLLRRDGLELVVSLTDETEVIALPDQEASLGDLQPGMSVQVVTRTEANGELTALRIIFRVDET